MGVTVTNALKYFYRYNENYLPIITRDIKFCTIHTFYSNPSLCSNTTQLACETGDLTGKHGTLLIPRAANRYLRAVYTDANLPLHTRPGLDSVFGQDRNGHLYISPRGGDQSPVVCAQSNAAVALEAPATDAPPTDGTTPIARVSSLIIFSISLLCVVLSVAI